MKYSKLEILTNIIIPSAYQNLDLYNLNYLYKSVTEHDLLNPNKILEIEGDIYLEGLQEYNILEEKDSENYNDIMELIKLIHLYCYRPSSFCIDWNYYELTKKSDNN